MGTHRPPTCAHALGQQNSGAVLIAVVGITAVLAGMLVLLLDTQRSTIRRLDVLFSQTELRYMALSGIVSSLNMIERDKNNADGLGDTWFPYSSKRSFPLLNGSIELQLRDATAYPNMNLLESLAPRPQEYRTAVRSYLARKQLPTTMVDATLDWLDSDDRPEGSGAEAAQYQSSVPPYRPANDLMTNPHELTLLNGVTPDDAENIAEYLSIIPSYSTVNINTADSDYLRTLLREGRVSNVITGRRKAAYNNLGIAEQDLEASLPKTVEFSVFSPFFEHKARVMLEGRKMDVSALIDRTNGKPILRRLIWQ